MAKDAVGPLERHLEKGVLALTLLLFVGAVVKFLITSPNTMLVNGRAVGPAQVYQSVANQGRALRDRIQGYQPDVEMPKLRPLRGPEIVSTPLEPAPVPWSPPVPRLEMRETKKVELVAVMPPQKPTVMVGRSGLALIPPEPVSSVSTDRIVEFYKNWNTVKSQDQAYIVAVNWVTVAGAFDVQAQARLAEQQGYLPGRAEPMMIGAEVERREKRWDGSYTDWASIKTYAPLVLPPVPKVEVREAKGKPVIPDDELSELETFIKVARYEDYRLELMRPMPAPVAYGDYWLVTSLNVAGLDLLQLDDEILYGRDEGNCPYWDRYPKKHKPKFDPKDARARFEQMQHQLDSIGQWIEDGCYEAAVGTLSALLHRPDEFFTPEQRKQRDDLLERATGLLAKKKKEAEERKAQGLPPVVRVMSPLQVLWRHDMLPDSVVGGKTYQYRMRALMLNSMAGVPGGLKHPEDAAKVVLRGDWSPPTDDVNIPYDTEFYLMGKKEREGAAKVEVFKWYEGRWVRALFLVRVGDPIGEKVIVKLGTEKKLIDFATGAIVVDLDFAREYRRRKVRRGKVTWDKVRQTLGMVYLDSAGELRERLLDVDKRSFGYKDMKRKVEQASSGGGTG